MVAVRTRKQSVKQVQESNKAAFVAAAEGLTIGAWIVTWEADTAGKTCKHVDVVQALKDEGLDEKVARELCTRHAFMRACKVLADERIIRLVQDTGDTLEFQFTKEKLEGERFAYEFETMLVLNKETKDVSCSIPELARSPGRSWTAASTSGP